MPNPKTIVRDGYDQLKDAYRTYFEQNGRERYGEWLASFTDCMPEGGNVLELGCADGVPTAQYLSQRFRYEGIDISPAQIALARQQVPSACFSVADMASVAYPVDTFDGILALYSIIHLPLDEQPPLFSAIYQWLKPGGYFLCVVGAGMWTGTESGWILPDVVMYWSHADAPWYHARFAELGFTIVETYYVPEANIGHTYFLLKKPG